MSWGSVILRVLDIGGVLIKYLLSSKSRKNRKEQKKREKQERLRDAIKRDDKKELNRQLRKLTSRTGAVIAAFVILGMTGCASTGEVVFIPEESAAVPMDYQGRDGWWLPDDQLNALMEAARDSIEEEEDDKGGSL